ncbi:restriction endonuclease subunit S [uncultured Streptococcus sp.]|uniref:restriction endonuclease subunit S n=1 Tax=uncultured Streptococcus sp. TaxID=83427 RepID=UPI0025830C39|nr:restriction endonuclease subunit S [uncultured Streptococcus sp.]
MTRMKESGIDWIGQIPEEWEVTRIKNIVSIERGASPRPIDKFISDDDTGVNWIRIGDTYKGNKYITSTRLKITNRGKQFSRYIHPGTLILSNSMSFGEPYISSIYGCIHDGWLSLAPYKNISKEYLYWLLLSDVCTSQFNLVSIGAVVENLSVDKVGNTLVSMPYSLSEQQKIADFLDKKTAQLDKVKILLEEQIQKLKDYRASLIYETVTKGLDKTVPMKDSGIDWIGQVPEGWGVSKLKFTLEKVSNNIKVGPFGSSLSGDAIRSSGKWVYNQRNVLDNNFTETDTFISDAKWKELKNFSVVSGDILLTTRGTIGHIAIVPKDYFEGILHPCLMKFRVDSHIVQPRLIKYFFNDTTLVKEQLKFLSNSTTIDVIYSYNLKNIIIPIIPLEEQYGILEYLDKQCSNVDALIKVKQEQIENINKQRQTLIYDYVTGKRRV